jgi:cytosine/uracil/thiamine/allantoin permease
MSASAVFLCPTLAVLICDVCAKRYVRSCVFLFVITICPKFWLVHRRKYDVGALYQARGRYYYTRGHNWRAFAAVAIALPLNLPGLAKAVNKTIYIGPMAYVYKASWLIGFTLGFCFYLLFNVLFPAEEAKSEPAIDFGSDEMEIEKEP